MRGGACALKATGHCCHRRVGHPALVVAAVAEAFPLRPIGMELAGTDLLADSKRVARILLHMMPTVETD